MRKLVSGMLGAALLVGACGEDTDEGASTTLRDALSEEFQEVTGLDPVDADCASEHVVTAVGEDELRDAGFPDVDPGDVGPELTEQVGRAMVEALEACDVELSDIATGETSEVIEELEELGGDTSDWELVEPTGEEPTSEIVVTDSGFSTYEWTDETWATAGVELRNDGEGDGARVEVTVTLRGPDGGAIATETSVAEYVPPGGEAYVVVDFWDDVGEVEPVSLDVDVADEPYPADGAALGVRMRTIEIDAGGVTILGSVANPTDERISFASIDCVLFGDGGIVGGVQGSLDPIAAGSDIAFEVSDSFDETFEAHAADCTAGVSL